METRVGRDMTEPISEYSEEVAAKVVAGNEVYADNLIASLDKFYIM